MNFLRVLGQTVDGLWALATIPLLGIAGFWAIYYMPILTFIVMMTFVLSQFIIAKSVKNSYNLSGDRSLRYAHIRNYTSGIIMFLSTILVFGVYIWFALTKTNVLCYDTEGMIPGTLPSILQWIFGKQTD